MFKTTFAGLTALEAGESLALDGYSFQALNPIIIDRLLKLGARTHRHDEHAGLNNPIDVPTITLVPDGTLPPDADISLGYTLVDSSGGETLMAPVAQVTTSPALDAPDAAPLWDVSNIGGHMVAGTYVYALTLTDPNGETTAGPSFFVNVDPGTDTNMVTISGLSDIVASVAGATGWRLYKSGATGAPHFLAAGGAALDYVDDDGLLCADCNVTPPQQNTTSVSQGVQFTVPATVTNAQTGVVGYRIYASIGGAFESPSFVEQRADFATVILYRQFVVEPGAPPDVNTSYDGAQKIDPDTELLEWHWKRPVANAAALPAPAADGDVRVTLDDGTFYVFRSGGWLPFTAPAAFWKPPVAAVSDLPLVGNSAGDVRLELETRSLWYYTGLAWVNLTAPPHEIWGAGPYPQRPVLQILGEGVAITDDVANHRTVVTITGGGGGSGPLALAVGDLVAWKDERGITRATLSAVRDTLYDNFFDEDYATAPALNWASAYVAVDTVAGVVFIDAPAPLNTEFAVRKGFSGYRDLNVDVTFNLVNVDWATVGIGIGLGSELTAYGIQLVIDNVTKQGILRYRENGAPAWNLIGAPVDVTGKYVVGDKLVFVLTRELNGLQYQIFNETAAAGVMESLAPVLVPTPLLNFEGQSSLVFKVADRAALTVDRARVDQLIGNYSLQAVAQGDFATASTTIVNSVDPNVWKSMGVAGAGWSAPAYRVVNGMIELSGRFTKNAGIAPVANEIMLTVAADEVMPSHDTIRAVVSGDIDGVDAALGMISFETATRTFRWKSGRSTDPVTKLPFMETDGLRFTV